MSFQVGMGPSVGYHPQIIRLPTSNRRLSVSQTSSPMNSNLYLYPFSPFARNKQVIMTCLQPPTKSQKKTSMNISPEFVQINPRVCSLQAAATIRAVCGLESVTWEMMKKWTEKTGGSTNHQESQLKVPFVSEFGPF